MTIDLAPWVPAPFAFAVVLLVIRRLRRRSPAPQRLAGSLRTLGSVRAAVRRVASRLRRLPWWRIGLAFAVLYVAGPQPHVEWNPGWSRRCPADAIASAARCFSNLRLAEVPSLPLEASTGVLAVVPPHVHVAVALTNPAVRVLSLDFLEREFLGFGFCDARLQPPWCGYADVGPTGGPVLYGETPRPARNWSWP